MEEGVLPYLFPTYAFVMILFDWRGKNTTKI